jgi:hypothetical protein
MSVINHIYNEERVAAIKKTLVKKTENGKPADYEIRLDGLPVVDRTSDVKNFDSYKKLMTKSTGSVSILLYEGQSRNNTHHLFTQQEEHKREWHPYMDMTPEQVREEIITHEKMKWENERLQKEVEQERKKNEKLKEENEGLDDSVTELESKIRNNEKNWGNIISCGAEDLIRRGIPLISKIPGAKGFAELIKKEEQENRETVFKRSEVKKAEHANQFIVQENPESQSITNILAKEFSKDKLNTISEILVSLAKRPDAIEETQAFLNKGAGKEKNNNTLKVYAQKAKSIIDSVIEWLHTEYKLLAFGLKNIKHPKKWL